MTFYMLSTISDAQRSVSQHGKESLVAEDDIQEAQLPQRDSASATHVFLGSLTDRALH